MLTPRGGWFLACAAGILAVVLSHPARADEHSIVRQAGDHPRYGVEVEPHLVLGLFTPGPSDGIGLGLRASIPIVDNGFVSNINNSVAIGFGFDWVHWNGCWRNAVVVNGVYVGDCSANSFLFPLVLQWNFYLSTHFSVFGEPGLAIEYRTWGDNTCYTQANGTTVCGGLGGVDHFNVDPFVFFAGGRYHFSQSASMTVRIGWPYVSVGVSFM